MHIVAMHGADRQRMSARSCERVCAYTAIHREGIPGGGLGLYDGGMYKRGLCESMRGGRGASDVGRMG